MLHFYHLGWDGMLDMDFRWFLKLYARIPMIEARRLRALLPIISYPHLSDAHSRKQIQDYFDRVAGTQRYAATPEHVVTGWARLRTMGRPGAPGQEPVTNG